MAQLVMLNNRRAVRTITPAGVARNTSAGRWTRAKAVPRLMDIRPRVSIRRIARTWEDDDLAGLGKKLKKIGKKIKNAFKGKNLLKTAAIAATAYGGYKLATSAAGKSFLSKAGSGLVKAAGSLVKSAPKIASSVIAYKTAAAQAAPVYADEVPMPSGFASYAVPAGDPDAAQPSSEAVAPTYTEDPVPTEPMPGWVIPAAIGAGVLLLLSSRK